MITTPKLLLFFTHWFLSAQSQLPQVEAVQSLLDPLACPRMGEEEPERRPAGSDAEGGTALVAAEALTPWEQHSAVINIPRFDYRAPSSLLQHSRSGFLITCPIKREKSATKEAISILQEYIARNNSETMGQSDTHDAVKKRKLCSEEIDAGQIESAETKDASDTAAAFGPGEKKASLPSLKSDGNAETSPLSLVKLTKSGLLLFTFRNNDFHWTVKILSNILHSLGSGTLKRPLWCHRILPIQETCILNEENLERVVSKLTQEHLGSEQNNLERSIKFAVGFNRRGIDETQTKTPKTIAEGSNGSTLLDRGKCFQVVAGAVKAVARNSSVDLTTPELVVLVEWLPVSGLPHGSPIVGVSVLPSHLIIAKPRLIVKPLVSEAKTEKRS